MVIANPLGDGWIGKSAWFTDGVEFMLGFYPVQTNVCSAMDIYGSRAGFGWQQGHNLDCFYGIVVAREFVASSSLKLVHTFPFSYKWDKISSFSCQSKQCSGKNMSLSYANITCSQNNLSL